MTSTDVTRRSSDGDDASIETLVAEFLLAREEGNAPPLATFLARHARFADRLAILLADVEDGNADATVADPRPTPVAAGLEAFDVIRHVSTAGGGSVYEARHRASGQRVALKILDGGAGMDGRDGERFRREAKMLRALDIVGVVPVLDAGEEGSRFWYAMKWIDGETLSGLRDKVKEPSHRLHPMRERARLVARLARILAAIHDVGILHRDIKPSNMMIDRTGEPVLIDFGIARSDAMVNLTVSADGILGTPRYLAPESVTSGNDAVTQASDQYGLGLVLWELCAGRQPFEGVPARELFPRIAFSGPGLPSDVEPMIPPDLEAVILRAIDADPSTRYASMEAFADDLERVARGDEPDRVTLKQASATSRWWRRHGKRTLIAASAVIVLGVAGWLVDRTYFAPVRQLEAGTRQGLAALAPWKGVTPELSAQGERVPSEAAEALAALTGVDARVRHEAAWIPFLAGRYSQSLQMLGAAAETPTYREAAFRELLTLLATRDSTTLAPTVVDAASGRDVELQYRVRRNGLNDEEVAAVHDAALLRAAPVDAADFAMEAFVRWQGVSLVPGAAGPTIPPVLADALAASRRLGTDPLADGVAAMVALAEDRPRDASIVLDAVLRANPEALGARILRGDARLMLGSGREALADFDVAEARLPKAHPAWGRLMGLRATAQVAVDAWNDAIATLDGWRSQPSKSWQDACIPHVLVAEFAYRRGDLTTARSRLENAIDAHPQWMVPYDLLIEWTRPTDPEYADRIESERAAAAKHRPPVGAQAYLRYDLRGLRPRSGTVVDHELLNRPGGR